MVSQRGVLGIMGLAIARFCLTSIFSNTLITAEHEYEWYEIEYEWYEIEYYSYHS